MPHTYSNSEYADMVYLYRFCDGNAKCAARHEYAARFPKRRLLDKSVFSLTFQQLKETESFNMVPLMEFLHHCKMKEEQLLYCSISIKIYQQISSSRSGSALEISPTVIWKTLSTNERPYHLQRVQHLLPATQKSLLQLVFKLNR